MSFDSPLPTDQYDYPGLPTLSLEAIHDRRERVFLFFVGLFLGTLAMINIIGVTRFIDLSFTVPGLAWTVPMPLAVGVLPYPVTFLCTDFVSELYGKRRANQLVIVGLGVNLWVALILWLGGVLPVSDGTADADLFMGVRSLAFGSIFASMVAYLTAQLIDVQLFHFWRDLTDGRHLWLRNNGSTMVSQLVDTVAVILIVYAVGGITLDPDRDVSSQLLVFIGAGYTFKLLAALLDTGPFYLGVRVLSRFLRLPPIKSV
ncbi:MAG: queuosine precursor transporter [Myxococcales bacterium]|nr:queuosine precursor transporter [Myxococcales bacterium]